MILSFLKNRWLFVLILLVIGSASYRLGSTVFSAFLIAVFTNFALNFNSDKEKRALQSQVKQLKQEMEMVKLANQELRK